jgi:hypothetical protein
VQCHKHYCSPGISSLLTSQYGSQPRRTRGQVYRTYDGLQLKQVEKEKKRANFVELQHVSCFRNKYLYKLRRLQTEQHGYVLFLWPFFCLFTVRRSEMNADRRQSTPIECRNRLPHGMHDISE